MIGACLGKVGGEVPACKLSFGYDVDRARVNSY